MQGVRGRVCARARAVLCADFLKRGAEHILPAIISNQVNGVKIRQ